MSTFQIGCAKGCGDTVAVTDEMMDEARKMNGPIIFQHETCPKDRVNLPTYRVRIVVSRTNDDGTEEDIASVGGHTQAVSFDKGFTAISAEVERQWERVEQMRSIVEQEDSTEG